MVIVEAKYRASEEDEMFYELIVRLCVPQKFSVLEIWLSSKYHSALMAYEMKQIITSSINN
ncbi:CLUMA_CG018822, isoform A [Clunio marinus]|uniref:CLUMA_CG018822, isoform A n=1 Tax=Clunio marinus TaxID=568069 RepID=A0A1J1J1H8_9DIPT|nr:CLUMA_CG018822, isoform A [Clunio marinus]